MRNILFSFILLVSCTGMAGMVEVPLQGVQRLVVRGWSAQLVVTGQPGAKSVRISGVDDVLTPGLYIVERKGNTIEIHMNEWDSKTDWKAQVAQKKPRRQIEIVGGALPLDVALKEGQVQLTRWTQEAQVTLLQGKVVSQEGQGPLEVNVHQGDIVVNSHKGKLKMDHYQGQAVVKDLTGDLDLSSFNGPVAIENSKGAMRLSTQNAGVKVLSSSGSLQLDNGKGGINVQKFQGRIDGATQEGALNIQILAESEVHLKSQSGRVQVQLPPGSGAGLNLISNEGEIHLPQGLRVVRGANEKSFRGRLRGDKQKASVVVRSNEGSIVIK